uniref:Uncharacterized protein n=1 Tax=Cacopsylla melanoneura TaxID=428564 RepID=A0A8D8TQE6_9HEMI
MANGEGERIHKVCFWGQGRAGQPKVGVLKLSKGKGIEEKKRTNNVFNKINKIRGKKIGGNFAGATFVVGNGAVECGGEVVNFFFVFSQQDQYEQPSFGMKSS